MRHRRWRGCGGGRRRTRLRRLGCRLREWFSEAGIGLSYFWGLTGDIINQETRVGLIFKTAILVRRGLEQHVELRALRVRGHTLETLVVVPSSRVVSRRWFQVRIVNRWAIGAPGHTAFPSRDQCTGWSNRIDHLPTAVELIDIRPVLFTDPERAVCTEKDTFGIYGHTVSTVARTAEAIAFVLYTWEGEWNLIELLVRAFDIGIEPSRWRALEVREKDGVEVLHLKVWAGWVRQGWVLDIERDLELLNAVLVVDCAICVPPSIWQRIQ